MYLYVGTGGGWVERWGLVPVRSCPVEALRLSGLVG